MSNDDNKRSLTDLANDSDFLSNLFTMRSYLSDHQISSEISGDILLNLIKSNETDHTITVFINNCKGFDDQPVEELLHACLDIEHAEPDKLNERVFKVVEERGLDFFLDFIEPSKNQDHNDHYKNTLDELWNVLNRTDHPAADIVFDVLVKFKTDDNGAAPSAGVDEPV